MKSTYLICSLILEIVLLGLAVFAPIYITPGYYWWTAFAIFLMVVNAMGFSDRLDTWK